MYRLSRSLGRTVARAAREGGDGDGEQETAENTTHGDLQKIPHRQTILLS